MCEKLLTYWRKLLACQPVEIRLYISKRRPPSRHMRPATAHRIRWTQGRRLCQPPRTPLPSRYQPLYVLSGGDQQRLDVHLLQPPETEPPHTVPVLGFAE